jgi:hypothetical protein
MIVPEQIFENRIKDMYIKGDETLGRISHICLRPGAQHFFLSSETMRSNPDYVSQNK